MYFHFLSYKFYIEENTNKNNDGLSVQHLYLIAYLLWLRFCALNGLDIVQLSAHFGGAESGLPNKLPVFPPGGGPFGLTPPGGIPPGGGPFGLTPPGGIPPGGIPPGGPFGLTPPGGIPPGAPLLGGPP